MKNQHLDSLLEDFICLLIDGEEQQIENSWREVRNAKNISDMGIYYAWHRYELTERLYLEWKKNKKS